MVEAIAQPGSKAGPAAAQIRVDGHPPSGNTKLYLHARPGKAPGVPWPLVMQVRAEAPLQLEEWTIRVLNRSEDHSRIEFEVAGSKTGGDGNGTSNARFVSRSGRVVLEPQDWDFKRAFDVRRQIMPVGYESKWPVLALFADRYESPDAAMNHARRRKCW